MSTIILIDPQTLQIEQEYHKLVSIINETEPFLDIKSVWAKLPQGKYSDQLFQLIYSAEQDLWKSRIKLTQLQLKIANIIQRANYLSTTTKPVADQTEQA